MKSNEVWSICCVQEEREVLTYKHNIEQVSAVGGRHSQYSCELLAWAPSVALHSFLRHCLVHRCPGSASDPLWGS